MRVLIPTPPNAEIDLANRDFRADQQVLLVGHKFRTNWANEQPAKPIPPLYIIKFKVDMRPLPLATGLHSFWLPQVPLRSNRILSNLSTSILILNN